MTNTTNTTRQTIKSIRSEAASKIAAIRAERDAAIEAIRVARAEAVAAKQAEEAAAQARAEYEEIVKKEQKPYMTKFMDALYPNNSNGMAWFSWGGYKSNLSVAELRQFNKQFSEIIKDPLYKYVFDCEAYDLNSQGPIFNAHFRSEAERKEWIEEQKSYFEKNGITLDLPEEQFQFAWDTYVQYCKQKNIPVDIIDEYGLGSIFDLEYICDVEPSRKAAFIDWAWPLQEAINNEGGE